MSKRYIDKDEAMKRISWDTEAYTAINMIPTADVVERSAYDQVAWERDTAIEQLASIGKGLGEKMDDVVERKRGKWIDAKPRSGQLGKVCSACGNEAYWDSDYGQQLFDYCPYCGSNNGEESDNG